MTRLLRRAQASAFIVSAVLAAACGGGETTAAPKSASDAKQFLDNVNRDDAAAGHRGGAGGLGRADLHHRRHRGDRRAGQPGRSIDAVARFAKEATRFDNGRGAGRPAPPAQPAEAVARRWRRLPIPKEAEELTKIASRLRSAYGKGKWCPDPAKPRDLPEHRRHHASHGRRRGTSRSCARSGKAGTPSRRRCARTTRASSSCRTRARRSSGFADTGAMWRAKYDMPPDEFTKELDRLWEQVRPLYLSCTPTCG